MSYLTVEFDKGTVDDSVVDQKEEEEAKLLLTTWIDPHPLYPDVTFKPRVTGVNYPEWSSSVTPTPEARMLQMSMKFIPLGNIRPSPADAPYLFKVPGHELPFTRKYKKRINLKSQRRLPSEPIVCIPRPEPPPEPVITHTDDVLGLKCTVDPNSVLKRAHENFVMAYVDCYNKDSEKVVYADTSEVTDPDKEISISCAACCKLPRRPRQLNLGDELEFGGSKYAYAPPKDYFGPVAFFPDFSTLFDTPNDVPQDATPGWIDSYGIFHPAGMGDALPPDAVLGWADKDGVFHPVITVKAGVRKGVVGVRMANTDGIGAYPGDPRLALASVIVGYLDVEGTVHLFSPADQVGYVNDFDDFFEIAPGESIPSDGIRAIRNATYGKILLMSRSLTQDKDGIPPGKRSGFVDENGDFTELNSGVTLLPIGATRGYQTDNGEVILISLAADDDDWWNRLPSGVIGGYIDANSVFHELKPGEAIPPPGVPAYKTADGGIVPIRASRRFPLGTVTGYLDENGEFHQLHDGEVLPPGAILATKADDQITPFGTVYGYIDQDGIFHEAKEGDIVPDGAILARRTGMGQVVPNISGVTLPEGAVHGYINQFGEFHELKTGEVMPKGSHLVARYEDGTLVPIGAKEFEGAKTGYVDENGEFHELGAGDVLPEGSTMSFQYEDGHVVPFIDLDVEPTPSGAAELIGYVDANGEFHSLSEGNVIPEGAKKARMTLDGKVIPEDAEAARMSLDGKVIPEHVTATRMSADGKVIGEGDMARIGADGDMATTISQDGKVIPEGTTATKISMEGNVIPEGTTATRISMEGNVIPEGTTATRISMEGNVIPEGTTATRISMEGHVIPEGTMATRTSMKGNVIPEGTTATRISMEGTVIPEGTTATRISMEGNVIPEGEPSGVTDTTVPTAAETAEGIPMTAEDLAEYIKTGKSMGYVDENGVFRALSPGQSLTGKVGFIGSDGKFHAIPTFAELGYLDTDGQFIVLQPEDTPPPNAQVGYRKNGKFQPLNAPSTQGYRDEEGVYHEISTREEIPDSQVVLQGVAGYLDPTLTFHGLRTGESVPKKSLLIYRAKDDNQTVVPDGGKGAYTTSDGTVYILKDGETPPMDVIFGYVDKDGVFHALPPDQQEGAEVDLRGGVDMTEEERKHFEEFKRNLSIQCDMETVTGSLDLGEVFRRSFRIYTHGGSVDIDVKPATLPARQP